MVRKDASLGSLHLVQDKEILLFVSPDVESAVDPRDLPQQAHS